MWRPSRSASRGARDERRAGGRVRRADRPIGRPRRRRRRRSRRSRRGGPGPSGRWRADRPRARRSGSRSRRGGGRRSARVAGWAYISPSIAGATTTGAAVARQAAVTASPARPVAIAASQWAVAGRDDDRIGAVGDDDVADPLVRQEAADVGLDGVAGQRRERQRRRRSGSRTGVIRTTTSAPSSRRRRTRSAALYAAIEPVTPTAIRRPARRPAPPRCRAHAGQPELERLAAADLGVEDREALEGQVGVDRVDALERRAPTAPPTGRRSGSPGRRAARRRRPPPARARTRAIRPSASAW